MDRTLHFWAFNNLSFWSSQGLCRIPFCALGGCHDRPLHRLVLDYHRVEGEHRDRAMEAWLLHLADAATERAMILYHHHAFCSFKSPVHPHEQHALRSRPLTQCKIQQTCSQTDCASCPPIPQPDTRHPATACGPASHLRKGCSLRRPHQLTANHHGQPNPITAYSPPPLLIQQLPHASTTQNAECSAPLPTIIRQPYFNSATGLRSALL